jgi:AMMECR1 domain-containing protein
VTLHAAGTLRGCVGHVAADEPLGLVVSRMAAAAARRKAGLAPQASRESDIEVFSFQADVFGD